MPATLSGVQAGVEPAVSAGVSVILIVPPGLDVRAHTRALVIAWLPSGRRPPVGGRRRDGVMFVVWPSEAEEVGLGPAGWLMAVRWAR